MSEIDQEPFPKGALIAAGLTVAAALAITAGARFVPGNSPRLSSQLPGPPPAERLEINFADQRDGSVLVRDTRAGRQIAILAPGTNGFVRGVVRGLAHDRQRRGIGQAPPFVLMRWTSGRLALQDSATGRVIDLDAFGSTNKSAFADLMPRGAPA